MMSNRWRAAWKPRCSVDEKLRVLDVVFLVEVIEEKFDRRHISVGIEPNVENLVGRWFDGTDQPVQFTVDLDNGLVERDFLRRTAATGL